MRIHINQLVIISGFLLIILLLFISSPTTRTNTVPPSPQTSTTTQTIPALTKQYTSKHSPFHFSYPVQWHILQQANNKTDKVTESWILSNTMKDTHNSKPPNSAHITFILQKGQVNKQNLMDCESKTVICEQTKIHNTIYQKSMTVFNTGIIRIALNTNYKGMILTVDAVIQSGEQQRMNTLIVEEILKTFSWN